MARPILTKFGAIERQLEAAILLVLRDQFPEAVHTLVSASRGLLYGIHKKNPIAFLSAWDSKILSRVIPGKDKERRFYQNRVANFLKHADKDPDEIIDNVNLVDLNELELLICILAYWQLSRKMTTTLALGLFYCGLHNESWLDVSIIFDEAGLPIERIDLYRRMPRLEQRQVMLDVFDATHPIQKP